MEEIKCNGNNGNGCFMDSCSHNCGCPGLKEFAEKRIKTEVKECKLNKNSNCTCYLEKCSEISDCALKLMRKKIGL